MINNSFVKEIGLLRMEEYNKLSDTLIILFGLGGVGGYTFMSLVRTGIKNFILIDKDVFDETNINRQLGANINTLGKYKTDVYKEWALLINQSIHIENINKCVYDDSNYEPDKDYNKGTLNNNNIIAVDKVFENINKFNDIKNIFVADCIDDISAKLAIIKYCKNNKISIISSMGTANHISTDNIRLSDISKTRYCPLAKKIRKELNDMKIYGLDTLYFDEEPIDINKNVEEYNGNVDNDNKITHKTSTLSYVVGIAGMKIAEYIVSALVT